MIFLPTTTPQHQNQLGLSKFLLCQKLPLELKTERKQQLDGELCNSLPPDHKKKTREVSSFLGRALWSREAYLSYAAVLPSLPLHQSPPNTLTLPNHALIMRPLNSGMDGCIDSTLTRTLVDTAKFAFHPFLGVMHLRVRKQEIHGDKNAIWRHDTAGVSHAYLMIFKVQKCFEFRLPLPQFYSSTEAKLTCLSSGIFCVCPCGSQS